jgi:hypothetical protein
MPVYKTLVLVCSTRRDYIRHQGRMADYNHRPAPQANVLVSTTPTDQTSLARRTLFDSIHASISVAYLKPSAGPRILAYSGII